MTDLDPRRESAEDRALRAVILYKVVKGALVSLLALVGIVVIATGNTDDLIDAAHVVRGHFVGAWSVWIARRVAPIWNERAIHGIVLAMSLDGPVTLLEGWALHHGHAWGEWLVVVAGGALIPFEIHALFRHFHVGRLAILVVNVGVVALLAHRAYRRIRGGHEGRKIARAAAELEVPPPSRPEGEGR